MVKRKEYRDIMNAASNITNHYLANKQFNYDTNGNVKTFEEGFMVALKGGFFLPTEDVRYSILLKIVKQLLLIINDMGGNDNYVIGFWENEGKTYIDISINMDSFPAAFALAKMQDQIAIYSIQLNKEFIISEVSKKKHDWNILAREYLDLVKSIKASL